MLTGKRAPLIAGAAAVALAVLLVFFLILPKLSQVSDARTQLADERSKQSTLESQLAALKDAKNAAPQSQATIDRVDREIPPTADLPGLILLLQNAATSSGIDLTTITPAAPVFDATSGLSTISVSVNATGSYFALTEYMYKIETLPRVAKVLSASVTPGAATGTATSSGLTLTATLDMYTADTSAGPGSSPGPQGPSGSGG